MRLSYERTNERSIIVVQSNASYFGHDAASNGRLQFSLDVCLEVVVAVLWHAIVIIRGTSATRNNNQNELATN